MSSEALLRSAAKKVVVEVNGLKMWRRLEDREGDVKACWREVSLRWLPSVLGVLEALRACRDDPGICTYRVSPTAAVDVLSLQELTAIYTALELVAAWGVAPLVTEGVRPLERTPLQSARIPAAVRKWGLRNAMLTRELSRHIPASDRAEALEQCADVLHEVLASGPLAPVARRFAVDALAASLSARKLRRDPGGKSPFLDKIPLPWACAALRGLLGGCFNLEGSVVPTPKWCRSACATLLGDISKRSVDCVLKEFASVAPELRFLPSYVIAG
jgi:hypothetical protein